MNHQLGNFDHIRQGGVKFHTKMNAGLVAVSCGDRWNDLVGRVLLSKSRRVVLLR